MQFFKNMHVCVIETVPVAYHLFKTKSKEIPGPLPLKLQPCISISFYSMMYNSDKIVFSFKMCLLRIISNNHSILIQFSNFYFGYLFNKKVFVYVGKHLNLLFIGKNKLKLMYFNFATE